MITFILTSALIVVAAAALVGAGFIPSWAGLVLAVVGVGVAGGWRERRDAR